MKYKHIKPLGFTIVELLVAIAVVGILIAIVTVSYLGVAKRAAGERLKSDLIESATNLSKFKADKGIFPSTLRCDIPDSSTNLCVKTSSADVVLDYSVNTSTSPDTYGLTIVKANDNDISYRTVNGSEPIPCPVGYIVVPGSKTYNTSSFCVMKYEAKIKGDNNGAQAYNSSFVPESRASGTPWIYIDQNSAINEANTACAGCHIISDYEWMTIAQNVLNVPTNWSGGAVGSGHIYNGHNDHNPDYPLAASTDDSDGYFGTNDTAGDMIKDPETLIEGDYQKRTLTLSNGEVIWDFAGDVSEFNNVKSTSLGQPGVLGATEGWSELNSIVNKGSLELKAIYPTDLGIVGAGSWDHYNGIGLAQAFPDMTEIRAMSRGGDFNDGGYDGVLSFRFKLKPVDGDDSTGFRVTR